MSPPRIVITGISPLAFEGLRALLSPRYQIAPFVQANDNVLSAIGTYAPDILIVDLSIPTHDSISLLRSVSQASATPYVVALALRKDLEQVATVLQAGTSLVWECHDIADVLIAIERGLVGRGLPPDHSGLTPRQRQIMYLIAKHLTNEQIGGVLGLTARTVHFHRTNIRRRLGFTDNWQLLEYSRKFLQDEELAGNPNPCVASPR